ncbi:zinc finger protein 862-like [Rhizophagus clarus]|uniref:Zinc finger protein 862-like n=1 Tax=Rhizophagus clarus TaxID=94130 RepID=A0A8H3KTF2_9GLOM|nr:zinc finger protein 862-like [Rhizophagus clarus]
MRIGQFYLQSYKIQEFKYHECWKHIFDTDSAFITNFPNIKKLIQIGLIIPLPNANVERIFSQQKLLKNKLRNKMSLESLHRFLMILINGPELEEIDYKSAYEYRRFIMKERRFENIDDNTNM